MAKELKLPPLEPGEVRLHGIIPSGLQADWFRQMLEDSAKAVLAVLQQEARSRPDGFGRHILVRRGWAGREGSM